jgi:hypothetical protein
VATGLVALVLTQQALVDAERLSVVFHPRRLARFAGAAAALLVGWLRPAPWLLALLPMYSQRGTRPLMSRRASQSSWLTEALG